MEPQIVAMGGGGFAMEPENLLLERGAAPRLGGYRNWVIAKISASKADPRQSLSSSWQETRAGYVFVWTAYRTPNVFCGQANNPGCCHACTQKL